MKVYNEHKTKELTDYDLEKGKLVEDTITVQVPAVRGQAQDDYVIDGVYKILTPYVKAVPAHTEEQPILVYVPYTRAELEEIELEKKRDEYRAEKAEKESWLKEHDYIGVKIATGRATIEDYEDEIATMTEYAARIETLDVILGGNE